MATLVPFVMVLKRQRMLNQLWVITQCVYEGLILSHFNINNTNICLKYYKCLQYDYYYYYYSIFDRSRLIALKAINDIIRPITAILLKNGITVIGQFQKKKNPRWVNPARFCPVKNAVCFSCFPILYRFLRCFKNVKDVYISQDITWINCVSLLL